jgi:hypothetical protein
MHAFSRIESVITPTINRRAARRILARRGAPVACLVALPLLGLVAFNVPRFGW